MNILHALTATILLCAGAAHAAPTTEAVIDAPEVQLRQVLVELENINAQISSSEKINNSQKIDPQNIRAKNTFSHAEALFKNAQYLATSQQLNNFLNLTQVPEIEPYLRAQYMLGRSYEELGMTGRSFRAYLRYIASFITSSGQKDYAQLSEVMQRCLPLAAGETKENQIKINKLFSSVISLDMPEERRAEAYYFAASQSNDKELAKEWFGKAASHTGDPALLSRTTYFRALIEISSNNLEAAEDLLKSNLKSNEQAASEFADLSRLALARVAVRRQHPELAQKYYDQISETSSSYKSALFETTYIHLNNGQNDLARANARKLINKYPNSQEAFQIKLLESYLDLRSNDLEGANKSIDSASDQLTQLNSYIDKKYRNKSRISHTDLKSLVESSEPLIPNSDSVMLGYKVFGKIAELHRRLADIRGDIRNLMFTLGRVTIEQYRPQFGKRDAQLSKLSRETLQAGQRIMASVLHLYKGHLNPVEQTALAKSEQRRFRLFSHQAELMRLRSRWAAWSNAVNLSNSVSEKLDQLRTMNAQLASASYINKEPVRAQDLAVQKQKIMQMEASLTRSVELLRRFKFKDLANQGPQKATMTVHRQYANLLHEEFSILEKAFSNVDDRAWLAATDAARTAIEKWEFVSKNLYHHLTMLDQQISDDLIEVTDKIDATVKQHDILANKLENMRIKLETTLGTSVDGIMRQYHTQIDKRLAQQQKWAADINWIKHDAAREEKEAADKRLELEKQILTDNLRDLRQGVIW